MRFEIKKLLSNRIIVVLFALIMVASFLYYAGSIGTFTKSSITPEESEVIRFEQTEYNKKYNEQNEALIRSARRIKSESSDKYTLRLSDKIITVCENRRELPIGDNTAVSWFRIILDDTYISLLLIFFCVLISSELFCSDGTAKVFKLLFTSKNGRLVLYKNKILALMILSAFAAAVFTIVQIAAVLPKYGLTDINTPIQTEATYINCAYNIGFLEFVLAVSGTKILLCWFVCLITACSAIAFKNLAASSAFSAGFCTLLFVIYESTLKIHGLTETTPAKFTLHHALLKFSPICLLDPSGYFVSFNYVNVFGFPVTELYFNIAVTVLMTAALTLLGGCLFVRIRKAIL